MWVKLLTRCFFRFDWGWVGKVPSDGFRDTKIGIFLNHTSLWEPIFLGTLPASLLWKMAKDGVMPGADITMNRPVAGRLFKLITKDSVSISRKRDRTWESFLARIKPESYVLIAAEGRMKRPNGLDKEGRPMTVKGGIVDVLKKIGHGKMVLCYSAGLHHIQAPGDRFPKLFRVAKIRYEALEIESYLKSFGEGPDARELRRQVVADLENRRDHYLRLYDSGEL